MEVRGFDVFMSFEATIKRNIDCDRNSINHE